MGCCSSTPDASESLELNQEISKRESAYITPDAAPDEPDEPPPAKAPEEDICSVLMCDIKPPQGMVMKSFRLSFFMHGIWVRSEKQPTIDGHPHYTLNLRQNYAWREHQQDFDELHLYHESAKTEEEASRWVVGPTPGGAEAMAYKEDSELTTVYQTLFLDEGECGWILFDSEEWIE